VDGFAVRVPTATVSLVDFVVELDQAATIEQINQAFQEAAETEDMEGILGISSEALVSSDYIGTTYSAVVDLPLTMAMGDDFFKVVAWYDNEWGYATRVADLAAYVGEGFDL
jgi:glyceraldehyde 3-phosphate dehydrogenase